MGTNTECADCGRQLEFHEIIETSDDVNLCIDCFEKGVLATDVIEFD